MIYYRINNKIVLSKIPRDSYEIVSEEEAKKEQGIIYALTNIDPRKSRRSFCVTHPSELFMEKEDLSILKKPVDNVTDIPNWLIDKINKRQVTSINATYPYWEKVLSINYPDKWRINIVGLGDVGGTLVAGLRLMGGDYVSRVGIYDVEENRIKRWHYEAAQILSPDDSAIHPEIHPLKEEELFDCEIFAFCVSVGVPEVGKEPEDVRIAQFEGNAKILKQYVKMARDKNFNGLFIVVSDPVDMLCKVAFNESNKDENGIMDFRGLAPEQIRGYGLGVMHGRAAYFAEEKGASQYLKEGRIFGPHGEGVVVADSISNYNEELSDYLTIRTKKANLDVRAFGFKPFVAPALGSGTLAFIETIKKEWHYSATFMGGIFIGAKNRLLPSGVELETYDFPEKLYSKLQNTYDYLEKLV
ncbi:lactate/malate family dehydrogenase [Clostridium omnivorum]|uniref:Lactate/malate dehydrogenase N-terminal domain-containing protein n=1 Tax=Clostridium omnivorum TaxID=1604902 RepID=A0ABQ5NAS5_9CLOT|nr:lactate dehydrogenase [Clostridium sp. E14]GLC32155.1 hypothetical protein bsdE14_35650 [Clostridium sp. E14]